MNCVVHAAAGILSENCFRDVNGLKKKKKEIHDKTMKFENYATLTSVSYCLSLLQTLLIAGCIIFLLS